MSTLIFYCSLFFAAASFAVTIDEVAKQNYAQLQITYTADCARTTADLEDYLASRGQNQAFIKKNYEALINVILYCAQYAHTSEEAKRMLEKFSARLQIFLQLPLTEIEKNYINAAITIMQLYCNNLPPSERERALVDYFGECKQRAEQQKLKDTITYPLLISIRLIALEKKRDAQGLVPTAPARSSLN